MLFHRASDFKVQDVLCMTKFSTRSSSAAFVKQTDTSCQSNNNSERSAHFDNRKGFQSKQWLVRKVFGSPPSNGNFPEGVRGIRWKNNYLLFVEQQHQPLNYIYIYAADETLDHSNSLTVKNEGLREVPVKSSSHDKLHVTVMLTALFDGFKCRPYILLNKRPIKEIVNKFKNTLCLCETGRPLFNDDLFYCWFFYRKS